MSQKSKLLDNIKVKFTNRNKNMKEMLYTVNKTLKIPYSKSIPVQRVHFSTQKGLGSFLFDSFFTIMSPHRAWLNFA